MRLKPVFLVAPENDLTPKEMPRGHSRRAFLMGSSIALVVGLTTGHLGARLLRSTPESIDPMLAWARATQQRGDDVLLEGAETFLLALTRFEDPGLLDGLERIVAAVLGREDLEPARRSALATSLISAIEQWRPAKNLAFRLPELRALR